MNKRRLALTALLSSFCLLPSAFAQGPLNPPGPPAPTMKSLDEIDAKLNQANGKLDDANGKAEKRTPISTLPFTISAPGSYYVTGNLENTSAQHGITITSGNVTVDLMGFTLRHTGGGTDSDGISAESAARNIVVRNGSITGFRRGIDLQGRFLRIEDVTTVGNSDRGISCASTCAIVDGIAGLNGSGGIGVNADAVILRSLARENEGDGIAAANGAVVAHSTSRDNTGAGITVGEGATVQQCAAFSNDGIGIVVSIGSLVTRCTAAISGGHGISVVGDSLVLENNCRSNGTGGDGAGIRVSGNDNRIEGNNVTRNDRGVEAVSGGNLIIRNSASGNGPTNNLNYVFVPQNRFGPIVDLTAAQPNPVSGNAASSTLSDGTGGSHPWANFSY